jgi:predicted PurR-regulated permease PerM
MSGSVQYAQSRALWLLATLAILAAIRAAAGLFFPLFLAVLLYLILSPLVRRLARLNLPQAVIALMLTVLVLAIIVLGISLLVEPAIDWGRTAPEKLKEAERRVRSYLAPLGMDASSPAVPASPEAEPEPDALNLDGDSITTVTGAVLSTTGTVVSGIIVVIVSLFFLLIEGDRIFQRVGEMCTPRDGEADSVMADLQQIVSRYLGTVTLINACLGIAIGCTMWSLGLPTPLLWGVMAALFNFVPFLGAMVGASVVFVVALLSKDGWLWVVLPPACYLLINSIEGYFITPMVLGRTVKLSPFMIFLALLAGNWLGGVLGMLVAVPFLVAAKIVCDHVPRLNRVARLIGDEEQSSP